MFGARHLVLAGLSLSLVHCTVAASIRRSGTDDSTPDDAGTVTAADAAPVKVDPTLDFAFDGTTLRAMIKQTAAPGASLFVSIFPEEHGEDRSVVDCSALRSTGQAVTVSAELVDGTYILSSVPTDPTFLAGRLDGTIRTGIHGCLLDAQGGVIASMATSLMNAWDNGTKAASPRIYHGIDAYVNGCMDDMGELPMFANGDFSCTTDPGMHVVPITATDSSGRVTTIDATTTGALTSAQQAATTRCDRPAWLGYDGDAANTTQCAPFTRIGRYINSQGTRFVFVCRRETVGGLMDAKFENINFIAHNPTSGKTCYLNNHLDGTVTDGTKVPAPNTTTSDRFWMDMGSIKGQRCPACHDSDPWMHSPWLDQAKDDQGHSVVPKIFEDSAYGLSTPYSIFGRESFVGTDTESQANWKQPQHLTNVGSCSSCHRIGANMTTQLWAWRSIGETEDWQSWLTPAFRSFANLHWMPTTPVDQATFASSPNGQSVRMIESCANNPSGCTTEDVPH